VCVTHISVRPRPPLFGGGKRDGLVRPDEEGGVPVEAVRISTAYFYLISAPVVDMFWGGGTHETACGGTYIRHIFFSE
jgi:hypothetical protein